MSWLWRRLCGVAESLWTRLKSIKITKQDLRIFIPSFLTLFASAFSITMVFPFLPFMIQFLLPEVNEEDIGKYAGFIAASLFLGRFFGCYVWGALADKKGRKPVIMISCILFSLATAAFGFSVHIYMAVTFRFLIGLFNGMIGNVKAIISETSTNKSQALGMSLITVSYSLGIIMGPAVSGALADPISQYNLTISDPVVHRFLTMFPYSLPCFFNFLLCIIALVTVGIWMPETLRTKKSQSSTSETSSSDISSDRQQLLQDESGESEREHLTEHSKADSSVLELKTLSHTQTTAVASTDSGNDIESETSVPSSVEEGNIPIMTGAGADLGEERDAAVSVEPPVGSRRRSSLVPFFNRRSSFTPSFFKPLRLSVHQTRRNSDRYTSLRSSQQRLVFEEKENEGEGEAMSGEVHQEVREKGEEETGCVSLMKRLGQSLKKTLLNLKLFLTTRETLLSLLIYCIFSFAIVGYDEIYPLWAAAAPRLGGLGWSLHEIGISQAVSGTLFLPFSFIFFPLMERRLGLIAVYQLNAIITLVCFILLPMAHFIPSDSLNPLRWLFVILVSFISRVTIGSVFVATALFINNSVIFEKLGEVNGLAHSLTALLRTVSPVFSGTIFSLSLSSGARNIGFPVNFYLIFIILALVVLFCTVLGAAMPKSINRQKVTTDVVVNNSQSQSDNTSLSIGSGSDEICSHSSDGNGPRSSV